MERGEQAFYALDNLHWGVVMCGGVWGCVWVWVWVWVWGREECGEGGKREGGKEGEGEGKRKE